MHWNDAYTDIPVGAIPKKFVPRPIPTPPPPPASDSSAVEAGVRPVVRS
jgi:hypothetical protein